MRYTCGSNQSGWLGLKVGISVRKLRPHWNTGGSVQEMKSEHTPPKTLNNTVFSASLEINKDMQEHVLCLCTGADPSTAPPAF